jgi:hypothetical protein
MATTDKKELRDLWVQWTHDAISKYIPPEKVESSEELVDDMIEVASQFASGMLDEYEATFGDQSGRPPEGRRSEGRRRHREEPDGGED